MSAEAVGGVILKWLWAPISGWVLWRLQVKEQENKELKARLDNTYTKREFDERFDMKMQPIVSQLGLLIDIKAGMEKLESKVNDVHVDIEVVKAKIEKEK